MSFYDNATAIKNKIETALVDENLVLTIQEKTYPITLIISQSQSPYAQMSFISSGEDGVSAKDSSLRFIFELDGLKIHTSSRLIITDALMQKLKGLAKKWHTAYTHGYFADHIGQKDNTDDMEAYDDDNGETVIDPEYSEDDEDETVIDPADIVIDMEENVDESALSDDADAPDPFAGFMDDDHDVSGLLEDE